MILLYQAYEYTRYCPTCNSHVSLEVSLSKCCKAPVAHKFVCTYCGKELVDKNWHKDCEKYNRKDN